MMQNYDELEIDLRSVHYTFRIHRGFKNLLRMQTEFKADNGVYAMFWSAILEKELTRKMIEHGPTMRIAFVNSKHDDYEDFFWNSFNGSVMFQNGRIIFYLYKHNAGFFISFDLNEFITYMIEYDLKNYLQRDILKLIVENYMWTLRERLLKECPTRKVLKKDFLLPYYCTSNDEIMLRFTQVLANYMRYKVVGKLKPERKKQQAN